MDRLGIRSPYSKEETLLTVLFRRMSAQLFIESSFEMNTLGSAGATTGFFTALVLFAAAGFLAAVFLAAVFAAALLFPVDAVFFTAIVLPLLIQFAMFDFVMKFQLSNEENLYLSIQFCSVLLPFCGRMYPQDSTGSCGWHNK